MQKASEKESPSSSNLLPSCRSLHPAVLVARLPPSWRPYAELMRLDKPAGFYAFYFPYVIGTSYAACLPQIPPDFQHLIRLLTVFLIGSVILRGVACAWNDTMDQDYDRKVARCRQRPVARGAISTSRALGFTAALALAGLVPLFVATLPTACAFHALAVVVLFTLYPFAKRVTYYPQVVLGFPFAWAIPLACAALGLDPFEIDGYFAAAPTVALMGANVLWTMIYDTIYAHQDIEDDVKAGVLSMAVRFAETTKLLATVLGTAQVLLLLLTGWLAQLRLVYFVVACGGAAIALAIMIVRVDLKDPASCAWWFENGFWFVGGSVAAGFFMTYLERLTL